MAFTPYPLPPEYMDMDLAKKFGSLVSRKRDIEDELRAVKSEIASLDKLLLEEMRNNQMERLHIADCTLYIHKMLIAKPKEGRGRADVVEKLRLCGLGDLVSENYNSNTLSAWVREQLANGEQLPELLSSVVDTTELVSVRGRRATSSPESKSAKAIKTLGENK